MVEFFSSGFDVFECLSKFLKRPPIILMDAGLFPGLSPILPCDLRSGEGKEPFIELLKFSELVVPMLSFMMFLKKLILAGGLDVDGLLFFSSMTESAPEKGFGVG